MHSSRRLMSSKPQFFALLSSLVLLLGSVPAYAAESDHRLSQGVAVAVGAGLEVTTGDYGNTADATVVTMPVLIAVNPSENSDLTLEIPLVYLSSRSSSDVVVTRSGGIGRRSRSVSTTSTTSSTTTTSATGLGDINLSAGWTLLHDDELTPRIRPMLYLKAPTGDDDKGLGTGTFEGGAGLSLSKWFGDFQLFGEAAYVLQNSTTDYQGKNYVSYSAGGGMQATDRLFVTVYGRGSSARIEGGDAPLEGRLKLNFLQSRRVVWELYGLVGFSDASPAGGGGVLMMYQF